MPDLVVDSLASRRGGRTIYSNLSFAVERGRKLLLVGGNGSGKTTLLRTLALLLPSASGRIDWQGADVRQDREAWLGSIGWLGHADAIKGDLTVSETLSISRLLGPGPDTASQDGWADHCTRCLASFGLVPLADVPCRRLSAGQRRRVGLARLVARGAPVWLLDEPTAALDAPSKAGLHRAIERHCADGGIAVIASHGDIEIAGAATLDLDHRGTVTGDGSDL